MSTRTRAHPQALGAGPTRPPSARASGGSRPSPAGAQQPAMRRACLTFARLVLALLAALLIGTLAAPHAHASRLVVSSGLGNSLLRFDGETGSFTDLFAQSGVGGATFTFPDGVAVGPNGNVYARSAGSVLQFDGTTGQYKGIFVNAAAGQSGDPLSFLGHFDPTTGALVTTTIGTGIDGPTGLTFGPDGNLYVSGYGAVMRYNGQTGALMGTFTFGGPAFTNATSVAFGPDNNLYVSTYPENVILQYNGTTGQFIKTFVPTGTGLNRPIGLTFGPDGNLYVCSYLTNSVLSYNGGTGAKIGTFTSGGATTDMNGPTSLAFGLDGNLYVSGYLSSTVAQYNGTTGAFIKDYVVSGINGVPAGALTGAFGLAFYLEAPSALVAAVQSQSQINLSWVNNCPDATGIEVWRKIGSGSYLPRALLDPSTTIYLDKNLIPNTAYSYQVRAVNSLNPNFSIDSGFSAQAGGTTPPNLPSPPVNLTAAAQPGLPLEIDLSWTNGGGVQDHVMVQRRSGGGSYQTIAVLDGSLTTYQDTTALSQSTTYTYQVQATNATGPSGWSSEASATTPGAPAPPGGLVATAVSGTQITLTWVNNSVGQTSIEVDRKPAGGSYAPLTTTLAGSMTTYTDTTGLSSNTGYTYHIRATNSFGTSDWSVEASATTLGPPTAPTGLAAVSADSGTQVTLTWSNGPIAQTGLTLQRKTGTGTYQTIATLSGTQSSYTDTGVSATTSYTYRISGSNSVGTSGWSSEASVTTLGAPLAPTNMTAVAAAGPQVTVTWTVNSPTAPYITLWRVNQADPTQTWVRVALLAGSVASFVDTTVAANATYGYRAHSVSSSGASSPWSNIATVSTNPPAAPVGLTVSAAASGTQVTLNWTNRTLNVTGIVIERKAGNGSYQPLTTLPSMQSSFTDSSALPNTVYTYHVAASNGMGNSGWSNDATVATPGPLLAPSNMAATVGASGQVTVSWTSNTPAAPYITLWRVNQADPTQTWVRVALLAGSQSSFVDSTVAANASYGYRAHSVDSTGASSAWSNIGTVTVGPPAAPAGLTVSAAASGTQVTLNWTNRTLNVTGIVIERKAGNGSYQPLTTLPSMQSSFTDSSALPNTVYTYHVAASNGMGNSGWSNDATVATPGPLLAPANMTAVAGTGAQVTVTWTPMSPAAPYITLWRLNQSDPTQTWVRVALLPGNGSSFVDTTVALNATYSYEAHSVASTGAGSPWSNIATVTVGSPGALLAPTSMAAAAGTGLQVTVTWINNSPSAPYITLWRVNQADPTQTWVRVALLSGNQSSFVDTTVPAIGTYSYRAHCVDSTGASSPWSALATVTVGDPTALLAPSNMTAVAGAGPQVTVTWVSNNPSLPFLTLWRVNQADPTQTWVRVALLAGSATSFVDTTVAPNTTYSYRAHSVNSAGASTAWCPVATVTTGGS